MKHEFNVKKYNDVTVYTLESASSGATGSGNGASVSMPIGGVRKRGDNLIAQEGDTIKVPVTQKPRQGPLRPQTGGGAHRDKKKEQKQGKEKHRKPFAEDHEVQMASNELKSIHANAKRLLTLVQQYGEQGDLEAWQQSKITKAADYLNSVLQSIGGEQSDTVEGLGKMRGNMGAYDADVRASQSGMGRGSDHRGLGQELAHETNNISISINGRLWKVVPGRGTADSKEEWSYLNNMKQWAEKKSASSGKKWTVSLTGANVTEGVAEGEDDGRDKFYYQRNNIWRVMDGDELVYKYKPERYEVVGAKKLLARFDDEGYDVTHVISPMGTVTYLYGKPEDDMDEGWQEDSQELEDWSKEVNKRLYRAHDSQRPALARQLSKIEQKNFGSSLNQGSLTEIVKAALMALQKGQMVHYDPEKVGQMPFGSVVGDDAKLIAKYNITRDELAGYRMLQDKNMVDNLEQFLKLRRLVRAKSWPLEYYEDLEKLTPEEAWLKMANDLNWSKDDMNEEVQAKTDDKLLAYYAQRKAEKEKKKKEQSQTQGVAEGDEYFAHLENMLNEDWQKVNKRDKTDGMSRKAVKAYRRENPGSKLKTAVTTKPSKLKKGGKAAKRRKSFCARMSGNKGPMKKPNGKPTPKALALRRWNCEEDAYMNSLNSQVLEKLNPQAPVDVWIQDFQKADPNKYHQFKNKTPAKKAQMAVAASYAAKNPSKKK